ncbi:type II Eco29kI restriction endonuclease [Corynebacterium phocae]|uniref:Type II Eco29kI restriction endonuclease n=1 Tax=Corynebacterium phocae TaxID=161895 RepID=A0A1L7D5J0_9CORY|nr:Eco29kI family restriction endonuclease [Corynebacterium phocae]APT93202.1 type II Eco29kI restriction endonuclease [Corynebacterium phocae]KAA8721940.1 Eco29kI family restriction endonuclease [Corynebacterium phocae]
MATFFDPLSYENLGASIARALEDQPVRALGELKKFDGAGIYALYYSGDHPAYHPLALVNQKLPGSWAIYVGKAEAENARKGNPVQLEGEVGPKLYNRMRKHAQSIAASTNLDIGDFHYRALTVVPTWVPLAEIVAIRLNHPVWNVIVDGLGNHDPGKGRYMGVCPRWDTLHPGRTWASRLQPRIESKEQIQQDALAHLRNYPHELLSTL